jgi:hypothetical protein
VLYLISLVATRVVTVAEPHARGVILKLATAALLIWLLLAQSVVPPVALVGELAAILGALVAAERTLFA